jgi:hypothetical protein
MILVTNDIQFNCDRKLMNVLLFLGFSNAFENVDLSLLCFALNSFLFSDCMEIIKSYMSDKYQCGCVDGEISVLVLEARGGWSFFVLLIYQ